MNFGSPDNAHLCKPPFERENRLQNSFQTYFFPQVFGWLAYIIKITTVVYG